VEDGVEARDRQRLVALIPRCQDPKFLDMEEIGGSSDWLRKNKEINLKT
jgi:hypothetical protein